ncbi:CPBP family intramembrane metalloprotease [Lutimonas saemankumensis]|uniref:CPBP family intramembrane glutamic endopeptidase n=1 Tax=Lutimonas saemankumensis TaxID=483016 RepID=UPI001CD1BB89|nr:CPBP family intramembrane glutamic endopeptidase [Lutimonas saemankumensis]MCA0931453.1 CPBP family intramembrane metalloprotease [Lutimonas saemankumensis]
MNFIEQAYTGKNDWWRYILTIIIVFLGWQLIGVVPLFVVALNKAEGVNDLIVSSQNAFADLGIDSNLYLFVVLLTFVFGLLALLFSVKKVHVRSIRSLITSRSSVDWNRVIYGFVFWFLISVLFIAIDYVIHPDHFVLNFKPVPFLILLVVAFLFIPLQTSFEELLFRGYLMQGLGIGFKSAAVPFLITSIGFGLMHAFNPEIEKLGSLILLYYIGTGFLFGIITLMDEGTELALGMHAANNIVAAVIVTVNWAAFQTEALFKDISEPSLDMYMFLPVFVVYPLVIYFLAKKYNWSNWKNKLLGPVGEAPLNDEN